MSKIKIIFIYLLAATFAFTIGILCNRRSVNPDRMEKCLEFYLEYRKDLNQKNLAYNLNKINLTPEDFQIIIDRFIYYRSKKSAMGQAMKLLNAFRLGHRFEVKKIEHITGMKDEPFRLDAEILAVFEKNPKLVDEAFES